jgi:NADH-ubiquinone oxidoreductase chain 1
LRKGPDKVRFKGLLQPISDAIKLFVKSQINLIYFNQWFFILSPLLVFLNIGFVWSVYVNKIQGFNLWNWSFIVLICFVTISTYFTVFIGWSSNSKYSILGRLRSVAQTISYEISLLIILLILIVTFRRFNIINYSYNNYINFIILIILIFVIIFFNSLVCELNRAPFDLSEGESELVSGFNTEFGGVKFTLIFLREYSIIIYIRYLMYLLFFNNNIIIFFFIYLLVWLRSSYPRLRYDLLIFLVWKHYLIFSILLSIIIFLKFVS